MTTDDRQDCHPDVATADHQVDGAAGKLRARLYTPPVADRDGVIVFFPPGGFQEDKLDEIDPFLRALAAETGHPVLGSAFTQAPVAPFPAAAEDAHAVLKWVKKHAKKLGWNGTHLIVGGIEAGGNLAAVSAFMARDRGGPAIAAQLLIMPMLDPDLSTSSMRRMSADRGVVSTVEQCVHAYRGYLPRAIDRAHPYASPLNSSRLTRLPPALILSAEEDPLRDEAEQYGARLAKTGIRAVVRRLPPIALADANARCNCARGDAVLDEIRQFFSELCSDASASADGKAATPPS